jgi:hypothetical protein
VGERDGFGIKSSGTGNRPSRNHERLTEADLEAIRADAIGLEGRIHTRYGSDKSMIGYVAKADMAHATSLRTEGASHPILSPP